MSWVARARRFAEEELWSTERYRRLGAAGRAGVLACRVIYIVGYAFTRERLRLRAAALTYMTMLSLVPALAVAFSIFAAFGGLRDAELRFEQAVVDYLSVTSQESVQHYLDRFVASAHAGAIGSTGAVGLVLTATGLLGNMERAFNDIWGVHQHRSFLQRFQRYWPLLTLGPLLFGVSLTGTAAVQTSALFTRTSHVLPMLTTGFVVIPLLVTCLGCTLLYATIPNTHVPIRYALVGGFVGGTLWEAAKFGYAIFARKAIMYSAIYGSLSAIPLSIIWLFVSWMVVLTGAGIAFAAQNARSFQPAREERPLSQRERERWGSWLLLRVYGHFESGRGPIHGDELLASTGGPASAMRRLLDELVERGLLVEAESRARDDENCFLPARSAEHTTLADLVIALRTGDPEIENLAQSSEPLARTTHANRSAVEARAVELLERAESSSLLPLSAISIAHLLGEQTGDPPTG